MRKLLLFPLTRLGIVLLLLAAAFIGRDVVANGVLALPREAAAPRSLITALVVWLTYVAYVRLVERRPVRELAARRALPELALGVAIGAGMIGLIVGPLWSSERTADRGGILAELWGDSQPPGPEADEG